MTIRGNDCLDAAAFGIEHLKRAREEMNNRFITGNRCYYIIWDELPVEESESIENE